MSSQSGPARILLLEDSDADARLIQTVLRKSAVVVERVDSLGAALVALRSSTFDLILTDLGLPDSAGVGTVESLLDEAGVTPIVVITGRSDEATAVDAVAAGAQDYLVKSTVDASAAIVGAVRYALERGKARQEISREEIRTAKAKFRALIECSEVVFVLDAQRRFSYVNASVFFMLGYEPSELIGRPAHTIVRYTRGSVAQNMSAEAALWRKDGSSVAVEYTAAPMFDDDGGITGTVMTFRDISKQNHLEHQIERTLRLASLGRVSASVVHDLNNLLMGLKPFVDFLRRRASQDETLVKPIGHILDGLRRGHRLLEEILRFTKPPEPHFETIDLATWLPYAGQEARGLVDGRTMSVEPSQSLQIRADADQLSQVLFNLIANARDATPPDGHITIGAARAETIPFLREQREDAARFAAIFVRDNGSGITPETRERMFEPLFTTRNAGCGLGLATASRIIAFHGGDILIDTEPGSGSSFYLLLPLP